MAVSQEFIEQVAEALNVLGDVLENSTAFPRSVELISDEEQIGATLSLPGVIYDSDPVENDDAQALRYVQIPWSILSAVLQTLQAAVENATETLQGSQQAIEDLQSATSTANGNAETLSDLIASVERAESDREDSESSRHQAEVNRQDAFQTMQQTMGETLDEISTIAAGAVHPPYIADGTAARPGDEGFLYQWDSDLGEYVKGQLISGTSLTVATTETARSIIDELI